MHYECTIKSEPGQQCSAILRACLGGGDGWGYSETYSEGWIFCQKPQTLILDPRPSTLVTRTSSKSVPSMWPSTRLWCQAYMAYSLPPVKWSFPELGFRFKASWLLSTIIPATSRISLKFYFLGIPFLEASHIPALPHVWRCGLRRTCNGGLPRRI